VSLLLACLELFKSSGGCVASSSSGWGASWTGPAVSVADSGKGREEARDLVERPMLARTER